MKNRIYTFAISFSLALSFGCFNADAMKRVEEQEIKEDFKKFLIDITICNDRHTPKNLNDIPEKFTFSDFQKAFPNKSIKSITLDPSKNKNKQLTEESLWIIAQLIKNLKNTDNFCFTEPKIFFLKKVLSYFKSIVSIMSYSTGFLSTDDPKQFKNLQNKLCKFLQSLMFLKPFVEKSYRSFLKKTFSGYDENKKIAVLSLQKKILELIPKQTSVRSEEEGIPAKAMIDPRCLTPATPVLIFYAISNMLIEKAFPETSVNLNNPDEVTEPAKIRLTINHFTLITGLFKYRKYYEEIRKKIDDPISFVPLNYINPNSFFGYDLFWKPIFGPALEEWLEYIDAAKFKKELKKNIKYRDVRIICFIE